MRLSLLLLIITFLIGCNPIPSLHPWKNPANNMVSCQGATCCYAASDKVNVCTITEPYNKSASVYFKVIERP